MSTFEQLCAYIGFGAEDSRRLSALVPIVEPHVVGVVDRFYDAILGSADARALLADDAQVERLKSTLRDWLRTLLAGPHDEAYYEKRTRIGHTHVRVGLPVQYMVTAMNVVRRAIMEVLERRSIADLETHASLHRGLDLDLAIMLTTYSTLREEAARTDARQDLARQFAETFDAARAVILQVDAAGRIRTANREAERLCGQPREQLIGVDLRRYFHPDDRERMARALESAIVPSTTHLQCRCLAAAGEEPVHID